MTPITIVVFLEAAPGKEQELKNILASLIEPTLEEEGCIDYVLHVNPNNPTELMFYENWSDLEAFDKHETAPHIQAVRPKLAGLLAKPMQISKWEMCG